MEGMQCNSQIKYSIREWGWDEGQIYGGGFIKMRNEFWEGLVEMSRDEQQIIYTNMKTPYDILCVGINIAV